MKSHRKYLSNRIKKHSDFYQNRMAWWIGYITGMGLALASPIPIMILNVSGSLGRLDFGTLLISLCFIAPIIIGLITAGTSHAIKVATEPREKPAKEIEMRPMKSRAEKNMDSSEQAPEVDASETASSLSS